MGTLLSFLKKYGKEKLTKENFCEVDALILSQLSYLNFEVYSPRLDNENKKPRYFSSFTTNKKDIAQLTSIVMYPTKNEKLIRVIRECDRYRGLKINYFKDNFDEINHSQFAAVTFFVNDVTFVAYRGTDTSINGWHENLTMCLSEKISSQVEAVDYLNTVAKLFNGTFYVGGHSKGGNLAQYASVFCKKEIQDRIIQCYNNDGPGFYKNQTDLEEFQRMKHRIIKFIPSESVVGNLLNDDTTFFVIKANNRLIFQHDPFAWRVKHDYFVRTKKQASYSIAIAEAFVGILNNMDLEKKNKTIEDLFYFLDFNDIKTVNYFKKNLILKLRLLKNTFNKMVKESQDNLKNFYKSLFKLFRTNMKKISENRKQYLKQAKSSFMSNEQIEKLKFLANEGEKVDWNIEF